MTLSLIKSTNIAGGFNPSQTAANSNTYWVSDSHGLILGT